MKTVAVLDFGGQYTHLIATRIRALGVRADIVAPETFQPETQPDLVGMVFSGGPHSVTEPGCPTVGFDIRHSPVPILGLCYGHQLLARLLGGTVARGARREYGSVAIEVQREARLFTGLPRQQQVWMSHGDHVEGLPPGLKSVASTGDLPVAAFESADGRCFGLQFHPEVAHTHFGTEMLDRFLSVCTNDRPWQPEAFHREIVTQVRRAAVDRKLLLLVSGGVDSLVALKLCLEAVGPERVHPIHVDTGMMRRAESEEIISHLAAEGFRGVRLVNAEDRFLKGLEGAVDPEEKRRRIGRLFVEVVEDSLRTLRLDEHWMLVQGTIYPDHIESGGSKKSEKIKTHHNRVAEIEKLIAAGRIIEPLRDLYKDEVRRLGRQLGLPAHLLDRHPFPGPGLGIRVLCSDGAPLPAGWNAEEGRLLKLLGDFGLGGVILPVSSVGVQGDSRTYLHPAAIWPQPGKNPEWESLLAVSRMVVNTLGTVNRVVLSSQPLPHGLILEPAQVTKARLDRLRAIDAVVREEMGRFAEIWQMPVVSLPATDPAGADVVVIRPITSRDAMTADVFRIPDQARQTLYRRLTDTLGVGVILYDLTSKPPGTIEWE